jgi:hypothetical protein
LTDQAAGQGPTPVRNAAHQPGEEIVTLRYFKIKKGSFAEFYKASEEGVWPYFEKIGSRVIGMWQVVAPEDVGEGEFVEHADYDEVYLMTRYASVEHWRATRDTVRHGGDGPDWDACRKALEVRRGLTIESNVKFLRGGLANNGPYFMPGLGEKYEKKPE